MNTPGIWEKLQPQPETIETLKKDLKEGKVPELPFFIVDQDDARQAITKQLTDIDKDRMLTNMIVGQYGNGKTNLLKYLQLYFNGIENSKVKVLYSRADVEQPDIILFLLKTIQDNYIEELISYIKTIRTDNTIPPKLANNFRDNFAAIKEYVLRLFVETNSDEDLKKLIYLGTGRLYTKGHFNEFDLVQLSNFNRREIFVLILNILSVNGKFIIFAIDEIEKIQEKSKLRFNQFLTSYRELIDLFNKIKGHYLLACFTDASDRDTLQETNEAFSTRIKPHILRLPVISAKDDVNELLTYLNELFGTNKDNFETITPQIRKRNHPRNRELIRHAIELLLANTESFTLTELLEQNGLIDLFKDTQEKLQLQGSYKSLHQKFFDPLENFLIASFLLEDTSKLDRRDNQAFIDEVNNKIHWFIFNENIEVENVNSKINGLISQYQKDIVIYSPIKLELSNGKITLEDENFNYKILDYSPEELFTLLNMFRDNLEKQDSISKVITSYTQNFL